jgi:hypothetical protein
VLVPPEGGIARMNDAIASRTTVRAYLDATVRAAKPFRDESSWRPDES